MTEIIRIDDYAITTPIQSGMTAIANMVLNTVSLRSQRDYGRALGDFLAWYAATGQAGLNKATINAHVAHLKAQGTVPVLERGLDSYFQFYNYDRPHQSLDYRTPAKIHFLK